MKQPRLVALDLSLAATGTAATHNPAGQPGLTVGTIRPRSDGHERLHDICVGVATLTRDLPDLVLIERLPLQYQHGVTTYQLAGLHGLVTQQLWTLGIPYLIANPAHLKIYATGRGNATKRDVLRAVQARYPVYVEDDNQADALAMLALGMHAYGHAPAPVPDTHSRAVGKVRWPNLAEAVSR